MAASHKKGESNGRGADSTLAFNLYDPKIDQLSLPSSESTLSALRKRLLSCAMIRDDLGLSSFENFVKNLRGVSPLPFDKAKIFILRTRKSLFLLSNRPPEDLYEMAQGFMDIDFKKRCILRNESEGKHLYLSLITTSDLERMRTVISASLRQAMAPTLAPAEGMAVDMADLRRKLSGCQVIGGNAESADMKAFAESVAFAITFKDDSDNPYYFIIAGKNEDSFRLYVNTPGMTQERMRSFAVHVQLRFGSDFALLCMEG